MVMGMVESTQYFLWSAAGAFIGVLVAWTVFGLRRK
jgi:hypothetical protein